jgi:hypothetical protein|tara:strand:- start:624 stop:845 length:222 start_codon:yes stop_codon:yes gene_type:complete
MPLDSVGRIPAQQEERYTTMQQIFTLDKEFKANVKYVEDEKPQMCGRKQIFVQKSALGSGQLPRQIRVTVEAI